MIKKLFLLLFVASAIVACNNAPSTEGEKVTAEEKTEVLTVDELLTDIDKRIGEEISVVGTVDHVCKHGGTKLVIYTSDPEIALHVKATDESGNFRADEINGEFIEVKGEVSEFRVDEAFILEKEADLEKMIAENGGEVEAEEAEEEHNHAGGEFPDGDDKHKQEIAGLQNQIKSLRAQLTAEQENGNEYISYFSVKCTSYKVLEQEDKDDVKVEGDAVEVKEHSHEHNEAEGHSHDEAEEHNHDEKDEHKN